MAASVPTRNSSLTRVRPFFDQLITRDPTGEQWLEAIVEGGSSEADVGEELGALDQELLLGKHHKEPAWCEGLDAALL